MGPMDKRASSGLTREIQFHAAVRFLIGNALVDEGIVLYGRLEYSLFNAIMRCGPSSAKSATEVKRSAQVECGVGEATSEPGACRSSFAESRTENKE